MIGLEIIGTFTGTDKQLEDILKKFTGRHSGNSLEGVYTGTEKQIDNITKNLDNPDKFSGRYREVYIPEYVEYDAVQD